MPPGRLVAGALFAALALGELACSRPSMPTATPSPSPLPPWTLLSTRSSDRELAALYARSREGMLEFRVETSVAWRIVNAVNSGSEFYLYLDTDRDARTGCNPNGWWPTADRTFPRDLDIGAEARVAVGSSSGRTLFRCEAGRWVVQEEVARVEIREDERWFEVGVPVASIGRPTALDMAVACLIGIGAAQDQMPPSGHLVLSLDR